MFVIVGLLVVLGMVFGSFVISGGKFDIIMHALPHEMMGIFGAAVGAFIISNSGPTLKKGVGGLGIAMKGSKWNKEDYVGVLSLLFLLLKTMRTKGVVAVEAHIENPGESKIFQHFSKVSADHHVTDFICDYMRMMTMNFDDPHQMEDVMEKDLEKHHHEEHGIAHNWANMSDGLPALGIVAAVLGIIKTMGSISAPVEVLGALVGGALTGTFLGILLSYGMVGPIAARIAQVIDENGQFMTVIKVVMVSHMHNNPPQISVEIGRKNIPTLLQPGFVELEDALSELPPDL